MSRKPLRLLAIATLTAGLAALAWQPWPSQADDTPVVPERADGMLSAIFAGGCFWCTEADFEKLPGVLEAISGYAGGHVPNPVYKDVASGRTGHAEVVQVIYDPTQVTYAELLEHFWINVDPTTPDQQFCDRGSAYRAAIFPLGPEQRAAAEASRQRVVDSGRFKDVHVSIEDPGRFWIAEDYHQDYAQKNPLRYRWYRSGCGRDARLKELWG